MSGEAAGQAGLCGGCNAQWMPEITAIRHEVGCPEVAALRARSIPRDEPTEAAQERPAPGEVTVQVTTGSTNAASDGYGPFVAGSGERVIEEIAVPPAGERPAPTCPACAHVSMTPAVARPPFGSVLVLAVGADVPEESVRSAAEALAAAEEGVTVVTVRGVEALRVWEPAPERGTEAGREGA